MLGLAVTSVVIGLAGTLGKLGPRGVYAGTAASLFVGAVILLHRWPTNVPMRLRSLEKAQGPDERIVIVEFREEGALLGWDVGILWFERGGIGFAGRTVSFVIPRSMMSPAPAAPALHSTLRAPQLTAKVFNTSLGIVPIGFELQTQMTLARIEALPDTVTSETILPPTSLHPDLLSRGVVVRDRLPTLYGLFGGIALMAVLPQIRPVAFGPAATAVSLISSGVCLIVLYFGSVPPASIRVRLPKS